MITERRWLAVPPQPLSQDGTSNGVIETPLSFLFRVGMLVILKSPALPDTANLKVKGIQGTKIFLGDPGKDIHDRTDVSTFLVADGAFLFANEQPRTNISPDDIFRYVYDEEPSVAFRNVLVDRLGNYLGQDPNNPFFVKLSDGSVSIGTVNAEIEVQLSRRDNNPDAGDVHDSVRIGNQDGEISYTPNEAATKYAADVNMLNKLIDVPHDDIEVTQKTLDGDPEIIEVREGGDTKLTLTLIYDAEGDFQRVQRTKS